MDPRTTFLVLATLASMVSIATFPVVASLLAPFARVALTDIAFGFGPRLVRGTIGATKIEVRLVPMNSWVRAAGQNPFESAEDTEAALRAFPPDRVAWGKASPARRTLAFVLAPRLVVFAVAAVLVGPARGLTETLSGMPQLVSGMLHPLGFARTCLDAAVAALAREGAAVTFGLLVTKFLAAGLFTLPFDLRNTLTFGSGADAKRGAFIAIVQVLFFVGLFGSWLVAIVGWLGR